MTSPTPDDKINAATQARYVSALLTDGPLGPGRRIGYEYMRPLYEPFQFEDLSDQEQRDELLSAMGLMVEWASDVLREMDGRYPLMDEAVRYMGNRFGRWER